MYKVLASIFLLLSLLVTSLLSVKAQGTESIIYPVPPTQYSYFGQDHSYSVNFRGNGEAVVTMRAVLSNNSENSVSTVSLRVPKVDPQEVLVFQVIREPICLQYQTQIPQLEGHVMPPCLKYQEPNYYDFYSYGAEYRKAKVEYVGDTLEITLPKEIKANGSGSYLLYYRAFGYAKKNIFGAYNFSFETLKVNDKIRNLQVGINVDSDIYLMGAQGKVNYRYEDSFSALKSAPAGEGVRNAQVDTLYSQIGQGEISKNASNLAALESYSVKGSFADSRIKLFAKEIFVGAMVLVGFVLVVLIILKLILARVKGQVQNTNAANVLIVLGTSFLSSLLIFGYTILIYFFGKNIPTIFIPSPYFDYQAIFFLLLVVVSIAVYVFVAIVPALIVGVKRGLVWGILTFISTILWLGFYIGVLLLVILLFGRQGYSGPIPILNNSGTLLEKTTTQ